MADLVLSDARLCILILAVVPSTRTVVTEEVSPDGGVTKVTTTSGYSVSNDGRTVTSSSRTTRNTEGGPHVQTWVKETVTETSSSSPETIVTRKTYRTG